MCLDYAYILKNNHEITNYLTTMLCIICVKIISPEMCLHAIAQYFIINITDNSFCWYSFIEIDFSVYK